MLACALARATGASRIAITDIDHQRLDFAKKEGFADDIYALPRGEKLSGNEGLEVSRKNSKDLLSAVGMAEGFDVVYECSGVEPSVQLGVFVRPRQMLSFPWQSFSLIAQLFFF
jgi:L-iditol 2-dehydrogenase